MVDEKFTKQIQEWLSTPDSDKDIPLGASLLYRMNRNRILYTNILARPQKLLSKLKYELNKHLKYRLDKKTVDDVVKMNRTVISEAEDIIKNTPVIDAEKEAPQDASVAKGKREDHDSLPNGIKQLWDDNIEIFYKIKQLFETLKTMESKQPCDRYEYLKQLDELDKKYRANMYAYDSYSASDSIPAHVDDPDDKDPADLVKKINAARKYLSENKSKLAELKEADPDKYTALLAKVQARYEFLIENGQTVDADQLDALTALGLQTREVLGE